MDFQPRGAGFVEDAMTEAIKNLFLYIYVYAHIPSSQGLGFHGKSVIIGMQPKKSSVKSLRLRSLILTDSKQLCTSVNAMCPFQNELLPSIVIIPVINDLTLSQTN